MYYLFPLDWVISLNLYLYAFSTGLQHEIPDQKGNKAEWHGDQFQMCICSRETKDNKVSSNRTSCNRDIVLIFMYSAWKCS
uniref:Uncharacterized protein n=1 Tax=Aegilops tauschii subsp. strangulata TaxID=200361 RepID=A0A453PQV7_AEGTS